jgi:hypothetical protein
MPFGFRSERAFSFTGIPSPDQQLHISLLHGWYLFTNYLKESGSGTPHVESHARDGRRN